MKRVVEREQLRVVAGKTRGETNQRMNSAGLGGRRGALPTYVSRRNELWAGRRRGDVAFAIA